MLPLLFPPRRSQWVGPLAAVTGIAALIGFLVVAIGVIDLSAAKPHPEGWARFLHFTFKRSTAFHADATPPADLDAPFRVAAGAAYYGQVCARCHGGPGFGQNPVVLSMHPRPQYLASDLPSAGFTAPELFRIVKHGVKYSAMPSWPVDGRDDEIWHLVAFLRALPSMPAERFRQLAIVAHDNDPVPAPFGAVARQRAYALRNDNEPPLTSFSYRTPAYGFAGYALDADPVATCARCHGRDGRGGGAFPNLSIQRRDYLARALTDFAAGRRRSGFMQVIASELSPAQIDALARHYAALPAQATEPARPFPALGQTLALHGLPRAGLAPCASCHGVDRASSRVYPLLEGQSAWFIANQLRRFRSEQPDGASVRDSMAAVARRLDDRQIEAVAAYYAAQAPAAVQDFAVTPPAASAPARTSTSIR